MVDAVLLHGFEEMSDGAGSFWRTQWFGDCRVEFFVFGCAIDVSVAVDDDEDRAEGRLKEWFGKRYGNSDMASQVSVWGSTAKVTEGLAKVTSAGAKMILLNPAFDDLEHLEALSEEVLPYL